MKSKLFFPLMLLALAVVCWRTINPVQAQPASDARIERGRYLVECVAMCTDCHTPRNWLGVPDRARWLQGTKLDFKPTSPIPFATVAPPIAGLPTFATDEQAVKFLETGTNLAGKQAMLPMPKFRLHHEDAIAVVAYLRSLKR